MSQRFSLHARRPSLSLSNRRRSLLATLLAAAALTASGCDETPPLPAAPPSQPSGNLAAAPNANAAVPPAPTPAPVGSATAAAPTATPAEVPEGTPTPGANTEKAVRGVGVQGSKYGGGIITEPVRQYFVLRQATVFEIQIPSAMNLYHAEHNRFPKDWAEFKKEILDPASVQLPELREGDKYVYDGKTGELLVEHPVGEAERARLNGADQPAP